MTTFDRIERRLPDLMEDLASARVPDYFDDLVQATARTRQRPAWASLERWLPVDLTMPSPIGRARLLPRMAFLLLLGLLVVASALLYAGSQPPRIPAPFGPAANGSLFFNDADGNVLAVDPKTTESRSVLTVPNGATGDGVLTSRDGLQIAVMVKTSGGEQLIVANQDGKNSRTLPGTYLNFSEIDWSPDNKHLAIISLVAGLPSISILPVDGSAGTSLSLPLKQQNFSYMPDGSLVFVGTTIDGSRRTYGLYAMKADGTGLRPILHPTSGETDWLAMSPSPDGQTLLYFRWRNPGEKGRLHLVDIATGTDTMVQVTGAKASDIFEDASFSPDGKSILFKWLSANGNVSLAQVPVGGGAAVQFGPAVHGDMSPNALFSPDGRSVMAWYPSLGELWLLDPTGNSDADRKIALPITDLPFWQRIAP